MSPIQMQLAKESHYDVVVGLVLMALLFGCLLILPRWTFWFYLLPIAAFYIRYTLVRERRDEALLRAEGLIDGVGSAGRGTSRCYRSEGGICITDGSHHILVARHDPDAPLQLPHIIGRQ